MKSLLLGIFLIIVVGIGGFVYRNAVEHPSRPIACPVDTKTCPDGTKLSRTGLSCTFPSCTFPNISVASAGIVFAKPEGFATTTVDDPAIISAFKLDKLASTTSSVIFVREYGVSASTTALAVIQQTAISGTSGAPVSITAFSSSTHGGRQFTVATIERFEGVIDTAYYLARPGEVLRFDAVDSGVANWTDANLDISALPAHAALIKLLTNLQVL